MDLYTEDLKQDKCQLAWEHSPLKMKKQVLPYSKVSQNNSIC